MVIKHKEHQVESKTGTYVYDEKAGKVVKISDTAQLHKGWDVWYPKSGTKYFDKAMNREFSSKQDKVNHMKQHGLAEAGAYDGKKKYKSVEAGNRAWFPSSAIKKEEG